MGQLSFSTSGEQKALGSPTALGGYLLPIPYNLLLER